MMINLSPSLLKQGSDLNLDINPLIYHDIMYCPIMLSVQNIIYPRKKDDPMLKEFSELLNRLAGMGDEMGSFYRRLQVVPDEKFQGKETVVKNRELRTKLKPTLERTNLDSIHTIEDALNSVLHE